MQKLPPPQKQKTKSVKSKGSPPISKLRIVLYITCSCVVTAAVATFVSYYLTQAHIYYNLSTGNAGVVCQK